MQNKRGQFSGLDAGSTGGVLSMSGHRWLVFLTVSRRQFFRSRGKNSFLGRDYHLQFGADPPSSASVRWGAKHHW